MQFHRVTAQCRLLDAALMLFAKSGYEQASTAAIARAAQTSESQMIKYFENKAGLLIALLNRGWGTVTASVAAGIHSPAAAANLEILFRNLLTAARRDRAFFSVATVDSYRLAIVSSKNIGMVGFNPLAEVIRRLMGGTTTVNQSATCCAVLSLFEGAIRHQLFETRKDCKCDDEELTQVVRRTLSGLLNPK